MNVSILRYLWAAMLGIALSTPAFSEEPLTPADRELLGVPLEEKVVWQARPSMPSSGPLAGVSAAHLGGRRLLLKVDFRQRPNFQAADLKVYLGLPELHPGRALVAVVRAGMSNYSITPPIKDADPGEARVVQLDQSLWIAYDAPMELPQKQTLLTVRLHYRPFHKGEEYRWRTPQALRLPFREGEPREVVAPKTTLVLPDRDYRLIVGRNQRDERQFTAVLGTAYEAASQLGLQPENLSPARSFKVERPFVGLRVDVPRERGGAGASGGALAGESMEFSVDHPTLGKETYQPIKVGIPLSQGGSYETGFLSLRQGEEAVSFQATARSRWPDGSIRWLGLDFTLPPRASPFQLHFHPTAVESGAVRMSVVWKKGRLVIDSGPLKVSFRPERFYPFEEVELEGRALPLARGGIEMKGKDGQIYSTLGSRPNRLEVEEESAALVVVRAEGALAASDGAEGMRYRGRFFFRAGSPLVEVEWTTTNTLLKREFTDFQSLSWPLLAEGGVKEVSYANGADGPEALIKGAAARLRQWSDRVAEEGGEERQAQLDGAIRVEGKAGAVGVVMRDFWQRYPKGIDAGKEGLVLQLLPALPKALPEMPFYVAFPYVDQCYRMKWGMSFTERLLIDFSGRVALEDLRAMGQIHPVPQISPQWIAASGAVSVSASGGDTLGTLGRQWDTYFATLFERHEERRTLQRTYGFLNYGDWFGERGRNWGNNEYDTAHAFFQQYLRTAEPRYFRSALIAARHQADVDIIHAYPDPFYIGGNYIHGVAHTGTTSHHPRHGIWSQEYGAGAWAWNGHSWSEGMSKAWLLAGDRPVAHAALLLGEHLRWAMAPNYEPIPSSPRHAGWAIRLACDLYETFSDEEYLTAAKLFLEKADVGQGAHGGFLYSLYGGPDGNSIFMHGILLSGLSRYHSITADAKALEMMQKIASFLRLSWHGYWPYMVTGEGLPHPKREDTRLAELNLISAEGLAYLGAMTGNADAGLLAREAAQGQLNAPPPGATGQKVGNSLRAGVATLYWLEKVEPLETRVEDPSRQTHSSKTSLGTGGTPRRLP